MSLTNRTNIQQTDSNQVLEKLTYLRFSNLLEISYTTPDIYSALHIDMYSLHTQCMLTTHQLRTPGWERHVAG